MNLKFNKKKNLIPLFLSTKKNNNVEISSGRLSKTNFFSPLSFNYNNNNNNNKSNYSNNSLSINIKDNIESPLLKNFKQKSLITEFNSNEKRKNINLKINSVIKSNSVPPKAFFTLNKKVSSNKKNEKNILTKEEKTKLKSIIKNFQENKITTKELYKLDRNFPLNSLTKSNFIFLSKENQKKVDKNRKKEINKIFLTSSNMIGIFNSKTNKILEGSDKGMKFSKNVNEFRKQIINSYSDSEKKINEIKKKKLYYNEALNIFEEYNEKKIKEAQKLEENFYRQKSTSFFEGRPAYLYIKEINKSMPKNNTEIESNIDEIRQKIYKNNLIYNKSKFLNNNIANKRLKTVQSEKQFEESIKIYEKYLRKKFKNKAKIFADSLYNISDLPVKILKKKNNPNYFNLNINNLRRIIQINSIKKNSYSIEDDDLLIKNTKKLREEIRKTENSFYTLFKGRNNKYQFDFLKGKVRPSTIQKLNIMKNSHFGLPC